MSTWPDPPFGAGDLWMHREKMQQGARAHYLKLVLSLETINVSITIKSDTIKPDGVSHGGSAAEMARCLSWDVLHFCPTTPVVHDWAVLLCVGQPLAHRCRSQKQGRRCLPQDSLRGRKDQLRDIKHRGTTSGRESPNQSGFILFYCLSYANWFYSIIHGR